MKSLNMMFVCRIFFTLLLSVCVNGASAQYENFLHKPYAELMDSLSAYLKRAEKAKWSDEEEMDRWNRMKDFAHKHHDACMELGVEFYITHQHRFKHKMSPEKLVVLYREIMQKAHEWGEKEMEVTCQHTLADIHFTSKNYEACFAACFNLVDKLDLLSDEKYPDKIRAYLMISNIYCAFREYETIIPHLRKAVRVKITERNARAYADALNTLGLCYMETGELDSATVVFNRIIEEKRFSHMRVWKTWTFIATKNMADLLVMKGEYDQAIPLYFDVIDYMETINDKSFAIGATIQLAGVYVTLKNKKEAGKLFDSCLRREQIPERRLEQWFTVVSRYYALTGNMEQSLACRDSVEMMQKNDTEHFNAMRLLHVQQELHEEKQKSEKMTADAFRRSMISLFVWLTVFAFLLTVAIGTWMYYSRKIMLKNRGLFRQIKEQDNLAEKLEQMTKRYEDLLPSISPSVDTGTNETLPGDKQQRELVACLYKYLLKDKNLAQQDIDRNELLVALSTNRTYLYEAVKAVTGKTLQEYVYSLRLEKVKQNLENNSRLTIEAIAEECGFNSRSAFYRLFKEQYNFSPAEYRKIAREKQK